MDVWRVDLREVAQESLRLLSVGERERAARIANPARRVLWMRGRGTLRALLGGYLKRPAQELELVVGKHGKPALAEGASGGAGDRLGDAAKAGTLHFNLSHSGPMALYAFTAEDPVGVDIELAREHGFDEAALGKRIFGAQAGRRLRELDAPARRREFLRLWVRHEAALKCLGEGLFVGEGDGAGKGAGGGAGKGAEGGVRKGASGGAGRDAVEPWIAELDLGPDIAAAVAVRGGPLELHVRRWPLRPERRKDPQPE